MLAISCTKNNINDLIACVIDFQLTFFFFSFFVRLYHAETTASMYFDLSLQIPSNNDVIAIFFWFSLSVTNPFQELFHAHSITNVHNSLFSFLQRMNGKKLTFRLYRFTPPSNIKTTNTNECRKWFFIFCRCI